MASHTDQGVNLDQLMRELQANLDSADITERMFTVNDMFNGRNWLTAVPFGSYTDRLKALLLRIPAVIYAHEQPDGSTYDVLHNGELVEALRNLQDNYAAESCRPMQRRIEETQVRVVIFRSSMSASDASTCMDLAVGDASYDD